MTHFISVVIPTHNNLNALRNTLKSFCHQTFKNFEVVIADEGSADGTGAFINAQKWSFPLQYCYQEDPGYAAVLNLGWKKAKGDIIAFINDHSILDGAFLEEHYQAHLGLEDDNVVAVHGYARQIGELSNISKIDKAISAKEKKTLLKYEQDPFRNFRLDNLSVRKDLLQSLNGFDENFKEQGFQDAELGWRLRLAGHRFAVNPRAAVYVFSLLQDLPSRCQALRLAGHNAVLFRKKHPWFGLRLVNPWSKMDYLLYSACDLWAFQRLAKVKDRTAAEKKICAFFYSLGIVEALSGKRAFPSTGDLLQRLSAK